MELDGRPWHCFKSRGTISDRRVGGLGPAVSEDNWQKEKVETLHLNPEESCQPPSSSKAGGAALGFSLTLQAIHWA